MNRSEAGAAAQRAEAIQRATEAGLPYLSVSEGIEEVAVDLAYDLYHKNPDRPRLQEAAAKVYKELTSTDISPLYDNDMPTNHYLKGPPGHGKSAIFDGAMKLFCDISGMNLVTQFHAGQTLTENDFAYVKLELAGETSPVTLGGLPDKVIIGDDRAVMAKILNASFDTAKTAGASFFLFDDIHGAHESVKTALLGFLRSRSYQGHHFPATGIGLGGNMGDADGNNASEEQSAILGRCSVSYVENLIEDWARYVEDMYAGSRNNAGYVTSFVRDHPEHFAGNDDSMVERDTPRPQPRTWSHIAKQMDRFSEILRENGIRSDYVMKRGGLHAYVTKLAARSVGAVAGNAYAGFMEQMLSGIIPLAENTLAVNDGKLSKGLVENMVRILGKGVQSGAKDNQKIQQYQFCDALLAISTRDLTRGSSEDPVWKANIGKRINEITRDLVMATVALHVRTDGDVLLRETESATLFHAFGRKLSALGAEVLDHHIDQALEGIVAANESIKKSHGRDLLNAADAQRLLTALVNIPSAVVARSVNVDIEKAFSKDAGATSGKTEKGKNWEAKAEAVSVEDPAQGGLDLGD